MPRYKLPPYTVQVINRRQLSEVIDWGLRMSHVPDAWKHTQGEGVTVAVLDTGIDRVHYESGDLAGQVTDKYDFAGGSKGKAWDNPSDGHGTHVASIIAARQDSNGMVGVAPEAKLLVGKVLDNGGGSDASIVSGIRWAIDQKADIINMSLGSPGPSTALQRGVQEAVNAGIHVVVAAGNDGGRVNFPARYSTTIAVSAVGQDGKLADFSSRGREIDFACPGVDVYGCWLGGQWAKLSGTSMASPFLAGVLALTLSYHRRLPDGGRTPLVTIDDARRELKKAVDSRGLIDFQQWQDSHDIAESSEKVFGPFSLAIPSRLGHVFSVGMRK